MHDIGQGLDYDVSTDAEQDGLVFVRKCGEGPELLEILEMYDQKTPKRSALAVLVGAANEISTHRPGARREKAEDYIRRLKQIEEIATRHPGVQRAFALQNGREVRILVDSAVVDDAYGDQLADEITQRLEEELEQPGQIKLCLIREVRAVHYAR